MPYCQKCKKKAPQLIHEMLEEDNYGGEYFCSEECKESYGDY